MASKRGLDQDPDYEDVSERQNKRQKVLQEDAKEATIRKIENIIRQQFSQEILNKECEMELIDQRLHQARTMLDRLRACIVARYYSTAGQSSWPQNKVSASQPPSIHPAVRKHLGKTVRVPPIGPQGEPASASTEKVESMSAATSTCLGALLTMKEENKTPPDSSGVPFQSVPLNGQDVKKENKSAETKVESPNRSLTENRTSRFKIKKRIVFGNVSRYIPVDKREENDQSTHKWMVYVRGDANFPDISGYVKKVWFFLHPSYRPNDLVEVSQPPFHLTRRGWGEFPVRVQLHFKDSRNKRVDIIHQLKLDRTYTGLQTLGAETVVDVELERDINDKLRRIPRVKSEPVLSRQVLPASGKDSLAFKEDKSETKCKAAENVTRSQEVKVVNPIKVIKTEPGISEENSRMLSTVTGDTSKDRKERETLSLHQKMTTVISQKEGLLSSIDKIKQDKIVPVTSVPKAIRTTSAGGDTGYCETRTISPSSATTDQMNSSKWTHVQIKSEPQSNVSGWQNVAKLSQSTEAGSNVTMSFKPVKTGAQVGCTGFKPISANLSGTANVSVPKNVSSPRLLQSPNSTVSPSLDLRQDKSSLSSPNVVAASTPKITCIGTPATAAAPSGGQAPALPPAVYVKCIDNEGRVYLIPQHLLTKVTASAGNSTQTAPKHTLVPPATAASILTSAKSPVSTPSVTLAQTTQKNTSGLTNLTARSVTLPVQATSTAKTTPSGGSNTHPVVSVCQSGTSPGKSPILCVGNSPAIQTKTTVVGSGNNSATLTYIVPAPPAAKGSQLMSLLSGSQPLSGAQMVISNSCPTGTQLVPTNSVGLPAKNISLAGTSKLQVKAMPAVSTVTPAALSKSSGATRSGTPVMTPVASPNKNPTTQGSNSQIVIISGDLGTVKSQSRPGTASQSLTCPIIPQQSHITPNAPMRLDSSVSPPKNLHQNLMAIGGKGDQRVTLMASGGISLLKTPPGTSQLSPHPESCVAKAVAQPSAMMVLQGKACPSLVPSKPNASVHTQNLRIQGSSINIPGAVSPAGGAVVKTMAPRTVTSSSSAICHTNSSSPSLLTQTVKKSAGNVTGQSKTGEVQSLSGGSHTFLLKVVPDEETKSPVNQILLLPSTVTNTPTILQKGSTSIAHRNSTEKPANTMYMIGCGNNKAANDKPVTQASKMVKRITGLNRDKVGLGTTSAKEEDVEKTIRLEDYQSVEELVKCLVKKHPLWRKDLDRSIHPYCAPCQAAYLQWNVGKRRASEWMRAKAVQRKLQMLLPKHPSLSGEKVWSAKGIVLWCRQQCFTPWDDEIRRKLRREPPRPIIASHENFNSLGSSEVIMNKLVAMVASTDGHCDDDDIEVDVISLGDPVMRKIKKEPEVEGDGERKFLIPPTPLMEHVRDTAAQIGVDIQPVEVERNIFSTAVEEVVLAAMQSFIDDIIRRSVSLIFKEQRLPDELSLVELYRGIRSLPHCQFLTNQHLGIQVEDLPFPKTNFVQSQSLDRVT